MKKQKTLKPQTSKTRRTHETSDDPLLQILWDVVFTIVRERFGASKLESNMIAETMREDLFRNVKIYASNKSYKKSSN